MQRIVMNRPLMFCTAALIGLVAGSALAEPPSLESLAAKHRAMGEWIEEHRAAGIDQEEGMAFARSLLEGINYDELSLAHLRAIQQVTRIVPEAAVAANRRMDAIAAEPTADGARAGLMLITSGQTGGSLDKLTRLLRIILGNPELEAAYASGDLNNLFVYMAYMGDAALNQLSEELVAAAQIFSEDTPPGQLAMSRAYLMALHNQYRTIDEATRNGVRERLIAVHEAAINQLDDAGGRAANALRANLEFFQSPMGKGEFLGRPAPEVSFIWNSAGESFSSLEDLRGTIVVLDFWATWCGPCIRSFPEVAKLTKRYEGYDVKVIGVTSLQGRHHHPDGTREVTKDDPDKEFALMNGFIEQKAMSWTVAFTEQNVYNPDYGVQGIPHVAIIDAAGNVRHNGLHPSSAVMPYAGKTAAIDALLKEAGLKAPEPYQADSHD